MEPLFLDRCAQISRNSRKKFVLRAKRRALRRVSENGPIRTEETTPRDTPSRPSVCSVPGNPCETPSSSFRHEGSEERAQGVAVSPGQASQSGGRAAVQRKPGWRIRHWRRPGWHRCGPPSFRPREGNPEAVLQELQLKREVTRSEGGSGLGRRGCDGRGSGLPQSTVACFAASSAGYFVFAGTQCSYPSRSFACGSWISLGAPAAGPPAACCSSLWRLRTHGVGRRAPIDNATDAENPLRQPSADIIARSAVLPPSRVHGVTPTTNHRRFWGRIHTWIQRADKPPLDSLRVFADPYGGLWFCTGINQDM